MLVAAVVVMAAVMVVNVVVGSPKASVHVQTHIYIYIFNFFNGLLVIACGCLWLLVLSGCL